MTAKMGRPTDNPRGTNRIGARLTDDDIKMLNYCIEKTGLTQTEIVRKGISMVYEETKKNG